MIWSRSTSRTETVPNLALRILPDPRRHSSAGSGANKFGAITKHIRPIRLSRGRDGCELQCRVMGDYAICSDTSLMYESLVGAWATLEYRPNSNNKAIQKVLFRGVLASDSLQMDERENGVDIAFWDRLALADEPVEMFTGSYNIGTVMSLMDSDASLWPTDANGNRLGGIDPAMFERIEGTGMISLGGQPVPQAFADLLSKQKGLLPDIRYSSTGFMMLTARERGAKKIDLVVGRIKLQRGTQVYDLDVRSLRGLRDVSKCITRITGKGDLTRIADTAVLTPAWDRSLDDAVLENPSLPDINPVYRDVGKLYSVSGKAFPYNAATQSDGTFRPIVWGRKSALSEWMPLDHSGEFVPDEQGDDPLTGRTSTSFPGKDRRYRFDSIQISRGYSETKRQSRLAGNFVEPDAAFWELQLQAIYTGPELGFDSGYHGDLPIYRRRILRERNYSKLTCGEFFRELGTSLLGRASASPPLYDHTPALISNVLGAVNVTCKPYPSFSVVLPRCDFTLERGMEVVNMYDIDGDLVAENLGWFIETAADTYNTGQPGAFTTEVSFDGDAEDLLGGLVGR